MCLICCSWECSTDFGRYPDSRLPVMFIACTRRCIVTGKDVPISCHADREGVQVTVIPILTLFGTPFLLIKLECQIVPLENVRVPRVVNKFFAFYGERSFITLFTRAHHWSLSMSQMNPLYCVQSYLFKVRLDIVFPFLQAVSFPKPYIQLYSSPYFPHPSHSPGLYHRIFGVEYKP